jgi:calcineurin-like phosphoesterase family protein
MRIFIVNTQKTELPVTWLLHGGAHSTQMKVKQINMKVSKDAFNP